MEEDPLSIYQLNPDLRERQVLSLLFGYRGVKGIASLPEMSELRRVAEA